MASASFKSVEVINREAAQIIATHWDEIIEVTRKCGYRVQYGMSNSKRFISWLGGATNTEGKTMKIPTSYHYGAGIAGRWGRIYASGVSLQNLPRPIRQALVGKSYQDFDMVNAQPSILVDLCAQWGLDVPNLKYYVDHRDECLSGWAPGKGKMEVIKRIMGSDCAKPPTTGLDWWNEFHAETAMIHKYLEANVLSFKQYFGVRDAPDTKSLVTKKPTSSALAYICQDQEARILESLMAYLKAKGVSLKHAVAVFDGLMIPTKECSAVDQHMLDQAATWCMESLKLHHIKFINKPMKEAADLSKYEANEDLTFEPVENVALNDEEAAQIVLRELGDRICWSQGSVWMYNNGIWTRDQDEVTRFIKRISIDLNIIAGPGKSISRMVSKNKNVCAAVIDAVSTMPQYHRPNFVVDLTNKGVDRIYFRNGYFLLTEADPTDPLNVKKRTLRSEADRLIPIIEDPELVAPTMVRIPRDCPTGKASQEIIDAYLKVVYDLFDAEVAVDPNDPSQSDYMFSAGGKLYRNLLQHMARASAGRVGDKSWLALLGHRNCGKGVLSTLVTTAFGDYVGDVSGDNFVAEAKHTVHDAKKLSWLVPLQAKRIVFSSEITNQDGCVIAGDLIKSITSGGDTLKIRALYQNEFTFVPTFRLVVCANELPAVNPPDSLQTMSRFDLPSEFEINPDEYVRKENLIREKLGLGPQDVINVKSENVMEIMHELDPKDRLLPYHKKGDLCVRNLVQNPDVADCFVLDVITNFAVQPVTNCEAVIQSSQAAMDDAIGDSDPIAKFFRATQDKTKYVLMPEIKAFWECHYKLCKSKVSYPSFRAELKRHFPSVKESTHLNGGRGFVGLVCSWVAGV